MSIIGDVLILGEIALDAQSYPFGTPAKISRGVGQTLGIAKLIGGDKTIDAMGRDPDPIKWSGRWRGPTAASNDHTMAEMARAGDLVPCSWGEYFFNCVVHKYTSEYTAFFDIEYSIELEVMPDADGSGAPSSLDDSVDSDMGSAEDAGAFQ